MSLWYLARAAGMVALMAFTVSTALGALAARRPAGPVTTRQIDARFTRQLLHRAAAVLGLLALATHVVLLVTDSYVDLSVPGVLVPFTAGYRALALGLSTIAVYLFVAVGVSGALRGRLATSAAAARRWRAVHLLAYVGWALSMLHGVLAGTDTGATWATAIYVACGLAVAAALAVRVASERRHRDHPLVAARRPVLTTTGSHR